MNGQATSCIEVFLACDAAIANAKLGMRTSRDKEFHFQNWFTQRLDETGIHFEPGGRNSFPDFRM